ncbi:GNAT family N-acyltransferase [Streptomyces rectiverticillatus]|uniref:GNAT family N-acyltransferase n=1 Tax=Streptomyces rectiverticillatus TaxID=173860 RepID=UPI0015C34359|nr:GNAT family N-acyltransferase [Streptomyces rectiverticillatus]
MSPGRGEVPVGVVSQVALSLRWVPAGPLTVEQAAAVAEIRAFRGRAWYEPVARPWFRGADGGHDDAGEDERYDRAAWHCLARGAEGQLLGCARVTPVAVAASSPVLAGLDAASRADVLCRMGQPARGAGVELGKLAVAPDRRGGPVASVLVALSLAVGRALGSGRAWGFVATGRGQDRFLAHYGCRDLGQERPYPLYGEVTRLMWCDLTAPAGRFEALVGDLVCRVRHCGALGRIAHDGSEERADERTDPCRPSP